MRIVSILSDIIQTMPVIKQFINEPRSQGNVLVDNSDNPFILLNRPVDMPFTYRANLVVEVYDFLLIYGVVSSNTQFSSSQDSNDVEILSMVEQARLMILNLSKHPEVRSVSVTSPMKDYINGFDVNAAGVFQSLRVELLPLVPDICATYP
jgi:hypothetical protein